jgi:4-carboxymuconolactone decarboxylase
MKQVFCAVNPCPRLGVAAGPRTTAPAAAIDSANAYRRNYAMSSDRMPPLHDAAMTDEQRSCAREIAAGPRGGVYGPFIPLLRSPELAGHAQRMGEYLRYRSAIGTLSELAILVVARAWSQQVEWEIHAPIALRVGIAAETIAAIAANEKPTGLPDEQQIVYDFCIELDATRAVSDSTYARMRARFGEKGIIDLAGINGYYILLAMVMNIARTPPAGNAPAALPPL